MGCPGLQRAYTRKAGMEPTGPGLISDLENMRYFPESKWEEKR